MKQGFVFVELILRGAEEPIKAQPFGRPSPGLDRTFGPASCSTIKTTPNQKPDFSFAI